MINDVEIKSIDQLMRDGIAAAQRHDQSAAQACFAEVLTRDDHYELGWLWLASVVDDAADKHECFDHVLAINPMNATARAALDKLDMPDAAPDAPFFTTAWDDESPSESPLRAIAIEVIGAQAPTTREKAFGVLRQYLAPIQEVPIQIRRQLVIAVVGAALILIALFITRNGGPSDAQAMAGDAAHPPQMAALFQDTGSPTPVPPTPTPTLTPIVVTASPFYSTSGPVTLPPTWTPLPSATSNIPATFTPPPPPPANLPGKLAILSGIIPTHNNYWPVIITAPDGSQPQNAIVDPDRAEYVQLVPDGKRMIFTYATVGVDSHLLELSFRNGSNVQYLNEAWGNSPGLFEPHGDFLSSDGHLLAFAAQDIQGQEQHYGIYVLDLTAYLGLPQPPTVTPLPTSTGLPTAHVPPGVLIGTNTPEPTAIPSPSTTPPLAQQYLIHVTPASSLNISDWPSIAPNHQFVAFTQDTTGSGEAAVDLYAALIQPGSTPLRLTTDGATLIKGASDWSPDSKQIAFTSSAKDDSFSDIELINSDGGSRQVLVHLAGTHNFRPHWSPDGKYLAFTSDRSGHDQVYMMDMTTHQLYQVTTDDNINILTDWASQ